MFTDPRLVGSWPALVAHLDQRAVVPRWSTAMPELNGFTEVDQLVRAWHDPQRTHEVASALVRLAAADGAGDDDALLVLLHLLSGVVWRLVRQLGNLSHDIPAIALSELACRIRSYPWRTRRGGVIANLLADTRAAVLAELRPSDRRHPDRVERLTADGDIATLIEQRQEVEEWPADDIDMVELLTAALASGVRRDDIALVIDLELNRGYGRVADETVAAHHHICERTLYRRRARTLAELRRVAARLSEAA
jgi:hypothetical protein